MEPLPTMKVDSVAFAQKGFVILEVGNLGRMKPFHTGRVQLLEDWV